jgi:hypothetical protein
MFDATLDALRRDRNAHGLPLRLASREEEPER